MTDISDKVGEDVRAACLKKAFEVMDGYQGAFRAGGPGYNGLIERITNALTAAYAAAPPGPREDVERPNERLDIDDLVENLRETAVKFPEAAELCNRAADAMWAYREWLYVRVKRALTAAPTPDAGEGK